MDRFWAKVEKSAECWEWTASKNQKGYGQFWLDKLRKATHVVWYLTYGVWPDGFMCHTCDNPSCVNPAHLYDGTRLDNAADAVSRGQQVFGSRHGSSKLTELQVQAIRQDTRSQRAVAKEYGVSPSHVCRVRRGEKYRDRTPALESA